MTMMLRLDICCVTQYSVLSRLKHCTQCQCLPIAHIQEAEALSAALPSKHCPASTSDTINSTTTLRLNCAAWHLLVVHSSYQRGIVNMVSQVSILNTADYNMDSVHLQACRRTVSAIRSKSTHRLDMSHLLRIQEEDSMA